ncbi:MAG: hypothetical protein QM638_03790 [Nocardioides sp.]|uniref:hypothetical protein n=1 Tax=Nocardioides sp. TaxID=35761 RepID=UPI0039E37437
MTNQNIDGHGVQRRSVLLGGAAAIAGAASLGATSQAEAATPTAVTAKKTATKPGKNGTGTLTVGAGKSAIGIADSLLPTSDGFTTVHDDLYVRVLLAQNGSTKTAIVVLDLTSISASAIASIRSVITDKAGVPSANIIVTVTHTFSAPHVFDTSPQAWIDAILAAATSATDDAVAGLQTAKVGYGAGTCDVNVNRNVETNAGYWLGTNESLPSDKTVGVARFEDTDGNPIALLVNYNVQSSVMMESTMANGDLPITPDLAGAAMSHVEDAYDGEVVSLFIAGATGDQSPAFRTKRGVVDIDGNWSEVDAQDDGWLLLTVQGERLGTEIVRVSETITPSKDATVSALTATINLPVMANGHPDAPTTSYDFTATDTADIPLWLLRIGEGAIAGVSPELSTSTTLKVKHGSPFKHTFVASMFEGGDKNMADRWNFAHVTYEAVDGRHVPGNAEKVAKRLDHLLNKLH